MVNPPVSMVVASFLLRGEVLLVFALYQLGGSISIALEFVVVSMISEHLLQNARKLWAWSASLALSALLAMFAVISHGFGTWMINGLWSNFSDWTSISMMFSLTVEMSILFILPGRILLLVCFCVEKYINRRGTGQSLEKDGSEKVEPEKEQENVSG